MKIYYWCPFISEVATVKAVINSIHSFKKFSKHNIELKIINVFGEWNDKIELLNEFNICKIRLNNFNFRNYLLLGGYLKSRFSYMVIFLCSFFNLHKLIQKDEPNYLICHLITSLPLFILIMFNYKTKFILRISGYPKLNFLRRIFWKIAGNKLFLITCPTKDCLKFLQSQNIFPKNKLIYLPDPIIDFNEIRKKKLDNIIHEKNFDKLNSIICIGRLTRQKNYQFLIDCFKDLSIKHKFLKLFIIGDGEERDNLQNQINKLKLDNKIFLLGYKKNVYKYLRSSYCFILSSLWEDPGFVLIEAASANTTIISSNCPNGPREFLDDGNNGFLFKNNSKVSFLETFNKFFNSNQLTIKKKKILAKRQIKDFTKLNHFKILSKYII